MSTAVGKTLGSFIVEEEIGRGGMGVVLRGRQESLDRPVVLKQVRRDLLEFPELLERFQREARAAAAVHHQNVVAVYDCFTYRGNQYIAQEFVDGLDLASALATTGALPWRIACLVGLQVAQGLEEIHGLGTVHRDLKPANILIGRRGEVKIADFGLALEARGSSLTQPGVMIGSPPYMPPEQMLGERVDARGDVFSLGVVLYEMLAGRTPYPEPDPDDEKASSLLAQLQREDYTSLSRSGGHAPLAIRRLIKRALRGKPRKRLASAREARRVLEDRLGRPSAADCAAEIASWLWERQVFEMRPNDTVVRLSQPTRRSRGRSWAIAAGVVILLLVGAATQRPESVAGVYERARELVGVLEERPKRKAAREEAAFTRHDESFPRSPEPD